MEAVILDVIVEAVIMAVRKDVINTLVQTECCQWSKRRMKKLCQKLQERGEAVETVMEAKDLVRKSLSNMNLEQPLGDGDYKLTGDEEDADPCDAIELEPVSQRAKIYEFVRKLTTV